MPLVPSAFRLRRFVAFLLLVAFVGATVSGVVLFWRPEGGIARWVGWSALGFDKKQWEALHIAFVVPFLLSSLAHIGYNWRPLCAYLGRHASVRHHISSAGLVPSLEFSAAVAVLALVAYGAIEQRQPLSSLLRLRADIKEGKHVAATQPPIPEADRLTVIELCRAVSASEQQAVSNARRRGIIIRDTSATIATIAREHHLTPEEVFEAMRGPVSGRSARP